MNILINSDSFGSRAITKWQLASDFIVDDDLKPVCLAPAKLNAEIERFLKSNETMLLIGGGDGSFHHAINLLMDHSNHKPRKKFTLGGLSLGSSGSFLRSTHKAHLFGRIPGLLSESTKWTRDLGAIQFTDENMNRRTVYFIANGSVGFLSAANQTFNTGGGLLGWLKKRNTDFANLWTFFKTLSQYQGQVAKLTVNEQVYTGNFLNIQFLKSEYYAGGYHFTRGNSEDSGLLDMHWFRYQGKLGTLISFILLSLNLDRKIKGHQEALSKKLKIESQELLLIEADGEIYKGNDIEVFCLPSILELADGL